MLQCVLTAEHLLNNFKNKNKNVQNIQSKNFRQKIVFINIHNSVTFQSTSGFKTMLKNLDCFLEVH